MDIFCVSGRIKALEKTFLTAYDISGIMNAKTIDEAAAILNERIYQVPQKVSSPDDILNIFNNTTIGLVEEMSKSLPEELYQFFLLPYTFHNIKLIIEYYRTGKENKNYLLYASVDYFTIKDALEKNNFKEIPLYVKPLVEFVLKNRDIKNIMLLAKNVYWNIAQNLVMTQNSDFINGYIKTEIDLSNIGLFLQQQVADISLDIDIFIEGGRIKNERFIREDVLWNTVNMIYAGVKTPVSIHEYDNVKYDLAIDYLKNARVIPFGIDTIFAYFAARIIEIDNLRRLLLGKFYNIDTSNMEDWVWPAYQYV